MPGAFDMGKADTLQAPGGLAIQFYTNSYYCIDKPLTIS